jgi:hypothetical protein
MGVRALSPNPKAGVDHPLPQGLDTEIHTMKLRQLLGRQKPAPAKAGSDQNRNSARARWPARSRGTPNPELGCSARRASVTGIREFHAATEPVAQI